MGIGMDNGDTTSIKAHKESNTLILGRNSNYAKPIKHKVNLIAAVNSRCIEDIHIDGNLELGKNAQVLGNVTAKDAILGPGSLIHGDLTVEGNLLALDGSKVTGKVRVKGSAAIRPRVTFGSLSADGMIELAGKPPSKHTKGKVVVDKTDK
jgi:predicted acyltransferase (DUF342 family)